jgi:putative FmdB family regulatory protein
MPIYEFRCINCNECFEFLVMKSDETVEMKCPHCSSEEFERIMSTSCHSMGSGGGAPGPTVTNRTCSSGSCSTYELPGHSK